GYYTVLGESPPRFWFVISYLAITGIVLLWLASTPPLPRGQATYRSES
ncbi:MAG: hypothetical protein QOK47_687, partial [Actinomycetota bacterium]|nr:hypothetical protein [Actinomycetota bacterium]